MVYALETDNYITWGRELKDSADVINEYMTSEIKKALEISNGKRKLQTCLGVTHAVARRFKTSPPKKHPLEDHLKETLSEEYMYPKYEYRGDSIYQDPFRFYLKFVPLTGNVNVNGVVLGTDKLSHFVSTGRRYFEHYVNKWEKGWDEEDAIKSAIRFGLKNEATILGMMSSGVFSYGDMEANYQGLTFYKKLCWDEVDTYLEQDAEGNWHLAKTPDIRDYVSPYWDETFNPSYRAESNWEKVSKVIRAKYCYQSPRLLSYDFAPFTSFSLEYIKELQAAGDSRAPIPQSVEALCLE